MRKLKNTNSIMLLRLSKYAGCSIAHNAQGFVPLITEFEKRYTDDFITNADRFPSADNGTKPHVM